MKHSTQELYDISPIELSEMTYKQALTVCKSKAIAKRANLVHEAQQVQRWQSDKEEMLKYLSKSIKWCEEKLSEME